MVIGGFSLDNRYVSELNIVLYMYMNSKLRNLVTEIWNLEDGTHKTIDPSLSVKYRVGLGLYVVPADFCNEN